MLNKPFDQIISEEEIQTLRNARQPHGAHPLVGVALHPGEHQSPSEIAFNTMRALGCCLQSHAPWVKGLKPRLVDQTSWSEADSALGEVRAMGALLEAGFKVSPGAKDLTGPHGGTQPEFIIDFEGQEVIVEVWTRTGDVADPPRIANELKESARTRIMPNGSQVTTSSAVHTPFGMPKAGKKGDSVLTNTISKLAGVKNTEHQARSGKPFVVWIDLQGETMTFDNSSNLAPLTSFNGALFSGGYWCAFYAHKGDLLFEGDRFRSVGSSEMLHEGRFYQTKKNGDPTRAAAFILSSPRSTAVFEHPNAAVSFSGRFRRQLVDLPGFTIERSVMNWTRGLVAETVQRQREWVVAIAQAFKAYDEGD